MRVIATTGTEPITLAEAKMHLRVDGAHEDDLILHYIKAARSHCERFTGLSFVAQTIEYQTDLPGIDVGGASAEQRFVLPLSPAVTITGFKDGDGDALTAADFNWSTAAVPTVISTSLREAMPVTVTYTTGAAMLTPDVKTAILMMLHQLYESRGSVDDEAVQRVEEAYLRPHRVLKGMA